MCFPYCSSLGFDSELIPGDIGNVPHCRCLSYFDIGFGVRMLIVHILPDEYGKQHVACSQAENRIRVHDTRVATIEE